MRVLTLVILLFILLFIELLYFYIANKYSIIDQPNHRSSHNKVTIRGGGIIFSIAVFLIFFNSGFQYIYFILGVLLISLISFVDDIKTINNRVRIICHLIATALLFYQLSIYRFPIYLILMAFIFVIGTINAVNFMDGINGITGSYSLLTILTLCYINEYVSHFTDSLYLIAVLLSLVVFNFFNFRIKAKCFAGDVGSVSIAFILLFFVLQLIIKSSNLNYILLFMLYGLDTSTTILFRLIKKENVFEAHRQHFYQFLANEKKIPHLIVAVIYSLTQAIINVVLIKYSFTTILALIVSICIGLILFTLLRVYFEGPKNLVNLKQ